VVLPPLGGAILLALCGGALGRRAHGIIGTGAIALSFAAAIAVLSGGAPTGRATLGPWLPLPGGDLTLALDKYGAPLMLMVAGVSALIALYSIGYLAHDRGTQRYFAALDLFVFAMLLIVLADNLLLLFAGWELVGLCSYLLIGHWRERPAAAAAAMKAFVVNRVGDVAFVVGLLAVLVERGTLSLEGQGAHSALASVLLLIGALAKSAQLPLHIWLPDAMEGPTPVSALIHAATMVTAGVVLLLRLGPSLSPEALGLASVLGAVTALGAAAAALVQTDLKRVLAWSTISQIGLMFVGAGIGAAFAALFHLLAHAFFKAALFLGAGSVMHGTDDEQDLRRLGGIGRRMRWTAAAFAAGAVGLAALPPGAGFFSKEAIAAAAADRPLLLAAVLLTALLSALYAARLVAFVVLAPAGSPQAERAHESTPVMLVPLAALGLAALSFGALVALGVIPLGRHDAHAPAWLAPVSVVVALAGAAFGLVRFRAGPARDVAAGPLRSAAASGFGVDAFLVTGGRRTLATLGIALESTAERTLDAMLDLVAVLVTRAARLVRRTQNGFVRSYEALLLAGAALLLAYWTLGVR